MVNLLVGFYYIFTKKNLPEEVSIIKHSDQNQRTKSWKMVFDSLSNCQLCQMILCLFFFLLLFVPDSGAWHHHHIGCITKTYQQILESRSSPWLSFATTRGDHGFQQFQLKFVRCILHPCVFLLLFHRECFGNMNWRSLENNFSKMEKQIKSLMHPRTKNYAANGVIIETLQFMGCASGAAMCWCNFSWPKVHWDCIDCITIVNWNQDINDFAFTI